MDNPLFKDAEHGFLYQQIQEVKDAIVGPNADHEKRLRRLERWKYGIPVSVVVALVTAIATALGRNP